MSFTFSIETHKNGVKYLSLGEIIFTGEDEAHKRVRFEIEKLYNSNCSEYLELNKETLLNLNVHLSLIIEKSKDISNTKILVIKTKCKKSFTLRKLITNK